MLLERGMVVLAFPSCLSQSLSILSHRHHGGSWVGDELITEEICLNDTKINPKAQNWSVSLSKLQDGVT